MIERMRNRHTERVFLRQYQHRHRHHQHHRHHQTHNLNPRNHLKQSIWVMGNGFLRNYFYHLRRLWLSLLGLLNDSRRFLFVDDLFIGINK